MGILEGALGSPGDPLFKKRGGAHPLFNSALFFPAKFEKGGRVDLGLAGERKAPLKNYADLASTSQETQGMPRTSNNSSNSNSNSNINGHSNNSNSSSN